MFKFGTTGSVHDLQRTNRPKTIDNKLAMERPPQRKASLSSTSTNCMSARVMAMVIASYGLALQLAVNGASAL